MSLSLVAQWAHPPVGRRMVGDQETAPGPDQGPWSLPPAPQPHITPPLGKAKGISEAGTSAPQPRTPRPPPPKSSPTAGDPVIRPLSGQPQGGDRPDRASHLPLLLSRREAKSEKLSPAPATPCWWQRPGSSGQATPRPPPQCARAGWGGRQRCQRPGSPEKSSAPACALLLNIHHKG